MKKIVWDWNGTLFDDLDLCFEVINTVMTNHGLEKLETLQDYRNVFGFPIIDYYKRVGFDFDVTPFSILAQEYMDLYTPQSLNCKLNEQAIAAMKYVLEQGGSQIILSASKIENLQNQINCFEIDEYLDSIWGIRDIYANSKEAIAHEFVKTCSDEIWFIGDSVHDYEVAKSVKANCILVSCGHQAKEKLEACNVCVFDSLLEGVQYIYEGNEY